VEAIERGELAAEIGVVIADVENAEILELARARGVRAEFVAPGRFKTKMEPEAEERVVDVLRASRVDWVILAGYMRMVKAPLLEAFGGRIVNIHPSLLPAFPGLEAWKQALAAGVEETGCTVHFVDAGMDTGKILGQQTVSIAATDTAESLHERIQEAEHQLYPEVLRRLFHPREGGEG
jgi:phosphoribosylglycinamide formyltransferase-1